MIRRAEAKDVEDLIKLRMALIREANQVEGEVPDEIHRNVAAYLREQLNKSFFVWVIEEAGEIIATSGLNLFSKPPSYSNPTGKEAFIMNIYVIPAKRGKGYAACLVKEMLSYLEKTPYKKVNLVATEAGRYVYEKLGFQMKDSVMEYSL